MKFAIVALLATVVAAGAANAKDYGITLKNNTFQPANLEVVAGEKVKLTVTNDSDKAIEFESEELDREKVIAAHDSAVVILGPLKAGVYTYVNDFHEETKGTITAK